MNNKAMALLSTEKYKEGLHLIETAIKAKPRNDLTWANRGRLLKIMGNLEEALKSVERAISINPYSDTAFVYEGDIFKALERYEAAERDYRKATEINPNNSVAWTGLGDLLAEAGRGDEADACYAKADEVNSRVSMRKAVQRAAPVARKKAPVEAALATTTEEIAAAAPAVEPEIAPAPVVPAEPVLPPEEKKAVEVKSQGASMMKSLEHGFNYIIMEERTDKSYELFRQFLDDGVPGFCITTTFPTKLIKRYGLQEAKVVWLSEAESDMERYNPKRLDFEITKNINNFVKTNDESVLLLDGFEYLVLENSFENVMKFIKKVNDLASMTNSTVLVPINPEAFSREEMTLLQKEFDRTERR